MVTGGNLMMSLKTARSLTFAGIAAIGGLAAMAPAAYGAGAGYSQFFLPGDEDLLAYVLRDLRNQNPNTTATTMHSLVAVTAWADNTIVIVDHWEDGYEYDLNDPTSSYDELFTLAAAGDAKLFEDSGILLNRTVNPDPAYCNASAPEVDDSVCVVDGRDIIYIIGTSATMTRGTWLQEGDTYQALAWEVYPVRPQLIKYVLPFGEELDAQGLTDFDRVYALIQATSDNTVLQIDFNNDGTYDSFDHDYNGSTNGTQLTLNKGEVYLLDRRSDGNAGTPLLTGTTILGSETLQVQYIVGEQGSTYEVRGLSAFPRGFWDDEYYAPADEPSNGTITDIYLYNPHGSPLTINWETNAGTGSFVIGTTNRTVSFRALAGPMPENGAVYLSGSDVFWGISSVDATGSANDWAYSLVPRALLDSEYFLGWAPGYSFSVQPFNAANPEPDASGLFITAVQDNTTVFIDENVDGTPDQTLTLDRLETAYVTSSLAPPALLDHDLSRARIYATGPYAMAYGQNPDAVAGGVQEALDLGYTVLPTTDRWFDLVLDIDKSASPTLLPATAIGATTTFTLRAHTEAYSIDGLTIVDTLPAGFEYVAGSTVVTLPDNTTVTGATADDGNATGATTMTWSGSDVFGAYSNLAENQAISISFLARTTVSTYGEGALATNNVKATGTRTVQGIQQVFTATGFAFVSFSNRSMQITKTSDVNPLAYPGDSINYTVSILNNGTAPLSNISLYDALPDGVRYVAASGMVTRPIANNVRDEFSTITYTNNNGSQNWASNWTETDSVGGGAASGLVRVAGGVALFAHGGASTTILDNFSSVAYNNNNGTQNWSGSWVETDNQGTTAGPTAGHVLVTGNTLQLRYQTKNVADNFDAASYANSTGSNGWAGDWVEAGDTPNGSATSGLVQVDSGNNNRVNFARGPTGSGSRSITRSATVLGESATISFSLTSQGNETGEGVVAEYDLGLGAGFQTIQTLDGGTLSGTNPLTISTAGASTITLRFRTFGDRWNSDTDNVGLDNVNILFSDAVGAQIQRSANLSGVGTAALSFDFNSANLEATDTMVVEASAASAGPFTVLDTFNGSTTTGSKQYSLGNFISLNTTVRFRVTNELNGTTEFFSLDNVLISYSSGATAATGAALARTVPSMVGASAADLTFNLASGQLEAGDTLVVEANSGAGFSTLVTYDSTTVPGPKSVSLAGHLAATTVIQFRVASGVNDTGEFFTIDNVDVIYRFPSTAAVPNNPPSFIGSADAITLAAGDTLTLTFQVTVDDPLATNITQLTNQACATAQQILLPLCAEVTDEVRNPSAEAGEVGDLVWLDIDGDGIKDPGEPGLSNIEVTLKDDFGTPIAVAYTDANGAYRFTGVLPGNGYFVEVTAGLGAGLTQTAPTGHSDNRSNPFNLAPGQVYLDADLGYRTPPGTGTIGDYVWQDINADGIQDANELGLGGVTVLLYRDVNNNGVLEPGTTSSASFACAGVPLAIPDNTPAGASATATVSAVPGVISGVTVNVNANHSWVGDLIFTLTSPASTPITLLDRPGVPASGSGCNNNNVVVSFADGRPNPETICTGTTGDAWPVALAAPVTPLAGLNGENANGVWTLNVSDNAGADTGTLNSCELVIQSVTGADGAPIATAVTSADGSYHFFGVDATDGPGTDDYFVSIDTAQTALTGYTAITFPQTSVANLGADEARLNNDFGFFPNASPRYVYRDRVWFDPNEDEQDDGETGIGGVTVNLLNAARQVITTVTTDANGYFDFAGLQGSTFYYVEISDTDSILSDFFGTTAEAIAGEVQISNLTADLDFTVEPTEPNFGYNAYGAVGDTVFNDLNGNGVQDPGESGIGGVTVGLYSDANGNGIVDGADAVIRTLVADANGNYLFAGIANGDYIVSVGTPPAGFTFTGSDSDGGTAGQQLAATVTAGGADLDADFGYQVTSNPRTVSGTLWNDVNNNGTLDDAGRFANVTLELRDSGGTLIATTTTNASGSYSFAGLPAAAGYQVRVTDTNGVLNGYQTTFEVTEGALSGSYNGLEIVNLSGGNVSNINFGYYRPPVVPLAVSLSSFHAERGGRGTLFEWTTDNEVGNVGFYLLGQVNGEWIDVSADLIPSPVIDSSSRQHYSYESSRGDIQSFILVDVDVSGKARYHGPFGLGDSPVSQPPAQLQIDWISVRAEHESKVAARRAAVLSRGVPTTARLLIDADGLHRISYESLAAAGFDFAGTPVASMGLFDRNGAVPMAVVPNGPSFGPGMAIEFFGTESKSLYNKRNHYTLRTDRSGVIAEVDGTAPVGTPQTTYQETTKIENDLKYTFGSPNGDPWYDTWVQAISGPASLSRSIVIEDLVPGAGSASLELGLWGVTYWPASPDHRVKARLNGVELVDETFDGHTTWNHQVAIDPALLNTGSNALLELQLPRDLPGVIYDIVAVDDYSITYPRRLTTRSTVPDRLYFSHSGAGAYRVDGFSSDNIVVYRREGDRMQRLTGSTVAWNGSSYEITFKGSGPADYFVQLGSTLLAPGVAPVPEPVALGAGPARLLVIAHPDFISDVQPLVDYRTAQGYSVDVVDVESIYERYSNGMVDPEAIRGYIAEAVANRATGYVLLVGGDSYDYRDRLGFASLSFIPSIYAATDELINHAPVDPLFGDIDQDGTVDVPVGRLPVRTSSELAGIIAKVQEFESKDYEQTLLAATDKYDADQGVSFRTLSDQLLQPLAGSWAITHADVETMGLAAAKQQVKDSLNEGTAYAQYFGHSSQTLWSFDRLFQASEVGSLLNQGRPALVAQWGCWNNYVVDPQVSTMGSALLTAADRGAAAVLGASTWTSTASDLALGTYFLPLVTQPGWAVGDVLVASKRSLASAQPGQHRGVQWGWTLLGDPLLVLQPLAPGSCRGNPATGDDDGDGVCDDIDMCIGSDQIGDIDHDGVCHDRDLCVGFPDGADADGDGVPDGCDLCVGDDSLGDPDGDGICGAPGGDIFFDGFEGGNSSE
jgi:uncharacterized repeat protein (TIGR01451 family)